jgi:hypothetical protein
MSCSSYHNISSEYNITPSDKVSVLPLINNSEYPMSGLKAKSIIESELYLKKINIVNFEVIEENEGFSEKDIKQILTDLKNKDISYAFYGYVNEWRYKAGIDSEPAVSITLNLYDLKNDRVVWTASSSKTSLSYSSTGVVAQKLINSMLSKIIIKGK